MAAERGKSGKHPPDEPGPPRDFAETTPPAYPNVVGTGYLVEGMMQMQKALGEVSQSVKHLSEQSTRQGDKLSHIEKVLYAANAIGLLVLTVIGFLVNKFWDQIVAALTHAGH